MRLFITRMECGLRRFSDGSSKTSLAKCTAAKRHLDAWARVNWLVIEKRFGSYEPPIRTEAPITHSGMHSTKTAQPR